MAKSGYKDFNVTSNGAIKIRFAWTAGTPNIANNFTPVNWTLSLISTSSSANISSSVSKAYNVTFDGSYVAGSNTIGVAGGASKILASGSKNIVHNADGTRKFTFSFNQEIAITYSGVYIGTVSGSGEGTLDTIPRSSILGTIANFTIGNAITIPVTKYSTAFSDTLNIYVGNTWIKRIEGLTNNQSVSFTTAELNTIYKAMANVTSAIFRFVNTTYNGANVIGTSEKTATGSINANIKPSISGITLTEANADVPSAWKLYVKGISRIKGVVNAAAGNGANIATYNVSINGTRYTTKEFTTDALIASGTNNVDIVVTDTRGRTATYSTTFNVIDYGKPYITSFVLTRKTATTATLKIAGGIYAINEKNTYSYKYKYKKKSANNYVEVTINNTGYSINKTIELTGLEDVTYDFVGIIEDAFNSGDTAITKGTTLSTTKKTFNVKPDGNGFAFFKKSEKNGMEVAGPIYDRFDTLLNNGLSVYRTDGEAVDPDTTLEELVLTSINIPKAAGFYYIRTMFYSTKSATANRTQIAYPYNNKGGMYCRYYINGTGWSEWETADIVRLEQSDGAGIIHFSNGLLIQYGRVNVTPTTANVTISLKVNFAVAYDSMPNAIALPNTSVPEQLTSGIGSGTTIEESKTSVTIYMNRINLISTTFQWRVIGYKKVV